MTKQTKMMVLFGVLMVLTAVVAVLVERTLAAEANQNGKGELELTTPAVK